jgi:hypothetical protein
VKWLALAAEQGHVKAQNNLGYLYYNGTGVPQNYAQAAKWYKLLAAKGSAEAQRRLGYMYAAGLGLEQDLVEAYVWFSLAVAQGMDDQRRVIIKRMSRPQIAEARRRTRALMAKAN